MPIYDTKYGKYFAETESEKDAWVLSEGKRVSLKEWNSLMSSRMASLASAYPESERHTWPTSVAEAKEFLSDPMADCPLITAAVAECGLSKTELSTIIINNANAFSSASGTLVGQRIAGKVAIESAETDEELDAVREGLGL